MNWLFSCVNCSPTFDEICNLGNDHITMNLREQLLKEHSKTNCDKIVKWIGKDAARFNELFRMVQTGDYIIAQRASWPLRYSAERNPGFLKGKYLQLLKNLQRNDVHEGVKRNTLNILETADIPEAWHGQMMDMCFRYLSDPVEKAAPKASSITILAKLAKIYPDILQELQTVIRDRWDFEGAAFRARARREVRMK